MNGEAWPTDAEDKLRKYYPIYTMQELKKLFPNRSTGALRMKAHKLEVKKTPQTKSKIYRSSKITDYSVLDITELAYIAGLFDGEGCITASISNSTVVRFQLCIANTNKDVMRWLIVKCDGRIYTRKPKNQKWRTNYVWNLAGNVRIAEFLQAIEKFLIIKKQQALLVISGCIHLSSPERHVFVNQLQNLNHN